MLAVLVRLGEEATVDYIFNDDGTQVRFLLSLGICLVDVSILPNNASIKDVAWMFRSSTVTSTQDVFGRLRLVWK